MAALPPPITATSLFRYKGPSQIAHQLIPLPVSFSSFSIPNLRGSRPVAMIKFWQLNCSLEVVTVIFSCFFSTIFTSSKRKGTSNFVVHFHREFWSFDF